MKKFLIFLAITISTYAIFGQGYNHNWLLGYDYGGPNQGYMQFDSNSYSLTVQTRAMPFNATQGNISDLNGNMLMYSNGLWIANANDTIMMNGGGLNPTGTSTSYTMDIPYGNIILPWPGDSTKYIMFHHTCTYDGVTFPAFELYYSIIDMTLDGGLGGVMQKNVIVLQDTLGWGIGACRHANGRDWWIVMSQLENDIIYKILLTNNGIDTITTQDLNFNTPMWGTVTQPTFSPDGTKFAYSNSFFSGGAYNLELRYANFDRCSGMFYNMQAMDIEYGLAGCGVAFSPNSKYLYVSSFLKIFQLNTDTTNIAASLKTVAINDGFYSPFPPFQTDFWLMYLAANGKIYLSSGNAVQHIHEINFPDNEGLTCDVQQHSIFLDYIWNWRTVPNHPNYYLGCDTTLGCSPCLVSVEEINHNFNFNIYPNPSSGNFNIIYLLPQNKEGKLEVFDINGKVVYEMSLPQWSTLQQIDLPQISKGIYAVKISSDGYNVVRKLIVTK